MKVELPNLKIDTLSGESVSIQNCRYSGDVRDYEFEYAGFQFAVKDTWEKSKTAFKFTRKINAKKRGEAVPGAGISFSAEIYVGDGGQTLRVGVPSAVYDRRVGGGKREYHSFMEDRLPGGIILFYDEETKEAVTVQKLVPAIYTEKEVRVKGQSRYLHKTEVTSMGYGRGDCAFASLCWPYEERETSVALDSSGTYVKAFYPLEEDFEIELSYYIEAKAAPSFTEALFEGYCDLADRLIEAQHADCGSDVFQYAEPAELPFNREEGMGYRRDSVSKTYREFEPEGAGFFFHFNPQKGYGSQPSGFGTVNHTIPHETYTYVLEYGFTGRQIDIALSLAKEDPSMVKKGEKVIDFFVKHCVCKNGWLYSLYDVKGERPFASFGDREAPRLHYMDYPEKQGNYLRTMTEPMKDLLAAYLWYRDRGIEKREWMEAVFLFADFLIEKQNEDGSWYRAYTPKGEPVFMNERPECTEEENDRGRKASTIIPVMFLCDMAEFAPKGEEYLEAAKRAGEYSLLHEVKEELYQGGTMDNPNIVDKEAAQYVMAGMYHLYKSTGDRRYLEGSIQAAKQFVTWNYIWNAPMRRGTILAEKYFRTKGMGAINSVWCGGVVDIYSLFHIKELHLLGRETGIVFFERMAEWISFAAAQILSCPRDRMGFLDTGMQPEGFGICAQGMDDGMIEKGDIWGTLGWIYSAGIGGMERYMQVI